MNIKRSLPYFFYATSFLVFLSLSSCKKEKQQDLSTIDTTGGVFFANLAPESIHLDSKTDARISFMGPATWFHLDLTQGNSNLSVNLIRKAIKEFIPLEVYVYPNTLNVRAVKPASEEAVRKFRESIVVPN